MRRLPLLATACFVLLLLLPATASAAVGDQLDTFKPSPSGNGRGIEMYGTSTTAFHSTSTSQEAIHQSNLKTHASISTILTNVSITQGYGALAWDTTKNVLWAVEFAQSTGRVFTINPTNGSAVVAFDMTTIDPAAIGLDGLSVDNDGSLWISADGEGKATTNVYHVTSTGTQIGMFSVSFGNSGVAVDGDNLWLADHDAGQIKKYDKTGAYAGVTVTAAAEIKPEDLTIDDCTFTGKKALWTYSSGFGGSSMAAYEIGDSSNTGCPASEQPPQSSPPAPGPPTQISPLTTAPVAGGITWLDATSGDDPTGLLFIYVWIFGDGKTETAGGIASHTYKCAGNYNVKVSIKNQFGVAIAKLNKLLQVAFPSTAAKYHRGIEVSPDITIKGNRVTMKVKKRKVAFRGKRAQVRRTTFILDKRVKGSGRVGRGKIKRKRNHTFEMRVTFKKSRVKKKIKGCFYA